MQEFCVIKKTQDSFESRCDSTSWKGSLPGKGIRRQTDSSGAVVFYVPASGRFGFFLLFSVFWLAITAIVSGGFLLAFLSGTEIEGDMPEWVMIPFFGLFWAIGLGMLYAAFREKYMKHRLTIAPDTVTLRKELFGRVREKSLRKDDIDAVARKEFYQKNYVPVYGIEIKGREGKLRFGSVLTDDEKSWLVAEIRGAVFDDVTTVNGKEVKYAALGGRKDVFSVPIPDDTGKQVPGMLIFTAISAGFVVLGLYVINDDRFFQIIWTGMSSVFACIGILGLVRAFMKRGQERKIEGNGAEVSIRTYRNGMILKDRSFPRNKVSGIRTSVSGSSNGNSRKRVELMVGENAERIALWMDGEKADEMAEEVKRVLGV